MESFANEKNAIIADLESYLVKIKDYSQKPLSELDYFEIHQYNVDSEEYTRLGSLIQQLNPLDRDELDRYFCAISQCSLPFSSFHVAAENSEKIDMVELMRYVDSLKKTIHKTIQYLTESMRGELRLQIPNVNLKENDITILQEFTRTPAASLFPKDIEVYTKISQNTIKDRIYKRLVPLGFVAKSEGREGFHITEKGISYAEKYLIY